MVTHDQILATLFSITSLSALWLSYRYYYVMTVRPYCPIIHTTEPVIYDHGRGIIQYHTPHNYIEQRIPPIDDFTLFEVLPGELAQFRSRLVLEGTYDPQIFDYCWYFDDFTVNVFGWGLGGLLAFVFFDLY